MLPHLNYNHKWFKVNIPDKTYQCERYEDLADEMNSYTNEFYFSFHEQLHKNVYPASQVSYTKQKHYKKCQIPINSWINACISNAPEIISCQHYNYFMFTFFFSIYHSSIPPMQFSNCILFSSRCTHLCCNSSIGLPTSYFSVLPITFFIMHS